MATIIGPGREPNAAESNRRGWAALGAIGVVFLVVGMTDLVLAWVPPQFGNADWEFATVTATFNNLPVPAMGVGLTLAGATGVEASTAKRAAGVVAAALAVWSLVAALFFALTLPLAWGTVTEPAARQALVSSTVKTIVQVVVYTLFFLWGLRFAWRRAR